MNNLPYLVYPNAKGNDTIMHNALECEWECGMAMNNRLNPLRTDNEAGRSGGFFSAGHELGDVIWQWPSAGDWVHAEGSLIWDRGDPPANRTSPRAVYCG